MIATEAEVPDDENDRTVSQTTENSTNDDTTDTDNDPIVLCCLRDGCTNPPVDDPKWEKEYCSSSCLIIHCKSIFQNWVQTNQSSSNESQPVIEIID